MYGPEPLRPTLATTMGRSILEPIPTPGMVLPSRACEGAAGTRGPPGDGATRLGQARRGNGQDRPDLAAAQARAATVGSTSGFSQVAVEPVGELREVLLQPGPSMPRTFLDHQLRVDPGLLELLHDQLRLLE